MIVKKMSQIVLETKNKEEAKTLFVEFVKNYPSLEFISWELVCHLIYGKTWVRKHFENALELGSYGQWAGNYELVQNENGVNYTLTLTPYVGDRKLIITCEYLSDPEGDYRMFNVVVDYTLRPTTHHQYSDLGVREYVEEEEEEEFVPRTRLASDEEDDALTYAITTKKEPHDKDDDPKYWGASQRLKD